MYIQSFFTAQTDMSEVYDVADTLKATEKVHYTRQGISNNDFAMAHRYKGLLQEDTLIDYGCLLVDKVDGAKYIVTGMRKTAFSNQCSILRCDSECAVYKLANKYVGTKIVGKELKLTKDKIPCVQKDTNGRIKFFDASLLESTIKLVYMRKIDNVEIADRLVVDNVPYQVDSIDGASIKNVLILQLSWDKRKI